jgi:hypothetical protein
MSWETCESVTVLNIYWRKLTTNARNSGQLFVVILLLGWIWGFCSRFYTEFYLLACNDMKSAESRPTFRRTITPPSSVSNNTLRKKPAWSRQHCSILAFRKRGKPCLTTTPDPVFVRIRSMIHGPHCTLQAMWNEVLSPAKDILYRHTGRWTNNCQPYVRGNKFWPTVFLDLRLFRGNETCKKCLYMQRGKAEWSPSV